MDRKKVVLLIFDRSTPSAIYGTPEESLFLPNPELSFHNYSVSSTSRKNITITPRTKFFSQLSNMSGENDHPQTTLEPTSRPVGNTEHSWCRAISGGTGIAVLTLQMSKPVDVPRFQEGLQKLQSAHPILRSKLHYNSSKKAFSFLTMPNSYIQVQSIDSSSTSSLLQGLAKNKCQDGFTLSPLQMILEHELSRNSWVNPNEYPKDGMDVFLASVYELPCSKWIIALRFHTGVCDRTTAVTLLRELMELAEEEQKGGDQKKVENKKEEEVKYSEKMGKVIEDLIPKTHSKKTLWAHGLDVLEYSVNSLRLTNLKFKDVKWPRSTEIVRLQMNPHETNQILIGCKLRGIKLCGALAAAALTAAHSSRPIPDQRKKYGVLTLTDCRSILEPPLSPHNFGFYHGAILNSHTVKGGDNFWDLATRSYSAFENAKKCNKHFSDMADLNFLLCRAVENPNLTASSSLRTSFISVFEDPVIDNTNQSQKGVGVDDFLGCASMHGVGPSIAFFDTLRDGRLDCLCVYPSPLHSRAQIEELVQKMKAVMIDATY
ncbi:OLC1v1034175C1 [Oldenlandia corymbosa var. corymbosa]|uniref:OLC1v1034175C1 n=1 Tax=Oldenlandia corymbosa var. corymbosa TaxID=529605 RepID=A0AAV1CQP8_OLDCO|nr:OLC1v1034175C1 [Oldenlandia corymbosa var. corymbosa]